MNTVKKSIPAVQSESAVKNIFTILISTHDELYKLSKLIPEKDHNKPLISGKRSFRGNLIHLLNIEEVYSMTLLQAITVDSPEVFRIHPERDIGKMKLFDQMSTNELLSYFKLRRKILTDLLKSLSKDQWSRVIIEKNKARKESVYWRMRVVALHEYEHIQIIKLQLR
ncbi:MAG TPA: DinB family protein [Ignavibacteria bacterium]|nr:DinB family protein [Ignavibacteria bacterium]HMR40939.1 DinB family protein [Ignavibacteria bacterium]